MTASVSVLRIIDSDIWRIHGATSWALRLRALVANRPFKAILTLRLSQMAARSTGLGRFFLPFFQILHMVARQYSGMDLPWRTRIGLGLSIQHGWGLVVNADARIGSNVTLYHGVTIGRADRFNASGERSIGYPTIEDEVWVGPHAIIVGGITVGRGSRILGGAFVSRDVPPYSIVMGNPAQVRQSRGGSDVMNKYPQEVTSLEHPTVSPTSAPIDRSPA